MGSPDVSRVEKMGNLMIHRGPDFGATFQHGPCVLGHRRLSILDLSEYGNQPMIFPEQGLSIVFNGEIYNFQKLRHQLKQEGFQFQTQTDTEVLLHGYIRWGLDTLCKLLHGMFAFAIWDYNKRELAMARDRFGEKPFYYSQKDGAFVFSSVATAISKTSKGQMRLRPMGITSFLQLGYSISPYHIIEGIESLEPGHCMKYGEKGTEKWAYWSLEKASAEMEYSNPVDAIETRLIESVTQQLISDVPLGCLLSGGVDSSLVASIAAEMNPNMHLFTVKMPGSQLDESRLASKIAQRVGGQHKIIEAKAMEEEDYFRFMGMFSEPLGDASALGVWMVAREAKKHVTVVLSGDGGDELFAGYKTIDYHLKMNRIRRFTSNKVIAGASESLAYLLRQRLDNSNIRKATTLLRLISKSHRNYHTSKSLVPIGFEGLLGDAVENRKLTEELNCYLLSVWDSGWGNSSLDLQLAYDIRTDLPGDYLAKVDTATMAHSLEARAPFLDANLAATAFSLNMKTRRMGGVSKGLLKELVRKRLGNDLYTEITREKKGFVLPIDDWFKGNWKSMIDNLKNSPLIEEGYLHGPTVLKLLNFAESDPERYSRIRYSLLAFDAWYRNQL